MKKDPNPAAQISCGHKSGGTRCTGVLRRTNDGADRLSEYNGRIVAQCDKCGRRFSLPVGGADYDAQGKT